MLLIITTLCAWLAWVFVLLRFDPFINTPWSPLLFYGSLGFALFGTFLNGGIAWNTRNLGRMPSSRETGVIIRHAVLLSLFVIIILNLAALRLLRVWSVAPLAVLLILVELFLNSMTNREAV